MVKPGGRLVYATCSLEPEENEAVVRDLLDGRATSPSTRPPAFPIAPDAAGRSALPSRIATGPTASPPSACAATL